MSSTDRLPTRTHKVMSHILFPLSAFCLYLGKGNRQHMISKLQCTYITHSVASVYLNFFTQILGYMRSICGHQVDGVNSSLHTVRLHLSHKLLTLYYYIYDIWLLSSSNSGLVHISPLTKSHTQYFDFWLQSAFSLVSIDLRCCTHRGAD